MRVFEYIVCVGVFCLCLMAMAKAPTPVSTNTCYEDPVFNETITNIIVTSCAKNCNMYNIVNPDCNTDCARGSKWMIKWGQDK